jgi:hypothetical protein
MEKIMKAALLILCSSLALLGCATNASQGSSAPAVDMQKVPTGDGSSSSLTCLQDPNCQ